MSDIKQPASAPAPTYITIDPKELAALVAQTVAQTLAAMPKQGLDPSIGADIGEAVAAGMIKNQRPKVSFGEYLRRTHSTTHPDPKFPNGPQLAREYWICGSRAEAHQLKDEEINLLNRITRSGRYLNRLVEIVTNQDTCTITWNNKTADQRSEMFPGQARDLVDALKQIVAAQEEEDLEEQIEHEERQERKQKRSGPTFGNTKAYAEAKAKAEAEASV